MPILIREDQGAIARLTLNAPEKLNALSDAMLAALQEEFDALREDRSIRARFGRHDIGANGEIHALPSALGLQHDIPGTGLHCVAQE